MEAKPLDRIYLQHNLPADILTDILQLSRKANIPVSKVPVEKLNSFNITGHEGCVAQIAKVQYYAVQDIISQVVESGEAPLFLILDGITDVRNIGAIARTAHCCGVHAIIIPDKGVGALNEDAILTSAGALEKIPVCRVQSLMKTVDELHLNGIKVYASEMKGDQVVSGINWKEPAAIILGSEEKGVFPALQKISDQRVSIPMANQFESLNVSVAAGMILYEVIRQRLSDTLNQNKIA